MRIFQLNTSERRASVLKVDPMDSSGTTVRSSGSSVDMVDVQVRKVSEPRLKSSLRRSRASSSLAPKHSVTFANVEMREFPVIPGDNPAVSTGVPITIDWEFDQLEAVDVENYEGKKEGARRSSSELRMPGDDRRDMLKRLGFTNADIRESVKVANIARGRRVKTIETLKLRVLQESFEKTAKGFLNLTVRRQQKKKEKAMIADLKRHDQSRTFSSLEEALDDSAVLKLIEEKSQKKTIAMHRDSMSKNDESADILKRMSALLQDTSFDEDSSEQQLVDP